MQLRTPKWQVEWCTSEQRFFLHYVKELLPVSLVSTVMGFRDIPHWLFLSLSLALCIQSSSTSYSMISVQTCVVNFGSLSFKLIWNRFRVFMHPPGMCDCTGQLSLSKEEIPWRQSFSLWCSHCLQGPHPSSCIDSLPLKEQHKVRAWQNLDSYLLTVWPSMVTDPSKYLLKIIFFVSSACAATELFVKFMVESVISSSGNCLTGSLSLMRKEKTKKNNESLKAIKN